MGEIGQLLMAGTSSVLAKLKHDSATVVVWARAAPRLRRSQTVIIEGHCVIGPQRRWEAFNERLGKATCDVDA
jgi:hypothetical protein